MAYVYSGSRDDLSEPIGHVTDDGKVFRGGGAGGHGAQVGYVHANGKIYRSTGDLLVRAPVGYATSSGGVYSNSRPGAAYQIGYATENGDVFHGKEEDQPPVMVGYVSGTDDIFMVGAGAFLLLLEG